MSDSELNDSEREDSDFADDPYSSPDDSSDYDDFYEDLNFVPFSQASLGVNIDTNLTSDSVQPRDIWCSCGLSLKRFVISIRKRTQKVTRALLSH